jgi:hypothetical protein
MLVIRDAWTGPSRWVCWSGTSLDLVRVFVHAHSGFSLDRPQSMVEGQAPRSMLARPSHYLLAYHSSQGRQNRSKIDPVKAACAGCVDARHRTPALCHTDRVYPDLRMNSRRRGVGRSEAVDGAFRPAIVYLHIMQHVGTCAWRVVEYNSICQNRLNAFIAPST